MKKLLFILLTVSIGFNLYLIDVEYVVQDDFSDTEKKDVIEEVVDSVKLAQSAIKNKNLNCECINQKKTNKIPKISEEKPFENIDEESKLSYSDKVREELNQKHKEWLEKSEKFFIDDLRISQAQMMRYEELKVARQIEMDEYFNPKMESNGKGDGTDVYYHTPEDTIFMGKITEKYNSLLKETFGEENYLAFREFVRKHNQSAIKNDSFYYTVEF